MAVLAVVVEVVPIEIVLWYLLLIFLLTLGAFGVVMLYTVYVAETGVRSAYPVYLMLGSSIFAAVWVGIVNKRAALYVQSFRPATPWIFMLMFAVFSIGAWLLLSKKVKIKASLEIRQAAKWIAGNTLKLTLVLMTTWWIYIYLLYYQFPGWIYDWYWDYHPSVTSPELYAGRDIVFGRESFSKYGWYYFWPVVILIATVGLTLLLMFSSRVKMEPGRAIKYGGLGGLFFFFVYLATIAVVGAVNGLGLARVALEDLFQTEFDVTGWIRDLIDSGWSWDALGINWQELLNSIVPEWGDAIPSTDDVLQGIEDTWNPEPWGESDYDPGIDWNTGEEITGSIPDYSVPVASVAVVVC